MTRISNKLIPNVVIFSIFMCFLGKTASAQIENYDETYYSPTKNEVVVEKYDPIVLYKDTTIRDVEQELILELEGTPMNTETKAKAKTVVVYDESDYYDYAYTARIRRFDNPVIGVGYYDDYYTNMYWYTYNPNYWGVSIYLGYNWWYPSWSWYYRPYYYSYWGYYDPFFNPYWNPYWDPFYYGHHHHHHHHHGHHHGHHHHYAWNCNHYYNSFDRGSFYYGPRTYNGATTRYVDGRSQNIAYRNSTARYNNRDNRSFGQRYESAIASRTNTSRGNNAGLTTPTRRGGVDINRNAYRSSATERTSSGFTGRVTTNNNDRTATTGRVTTGTGNRTTATTGRVTSGNGNRTTATGTTRQVSGSDRYSKPSSVENTRTEQYTRPTNRTSTSSARVSGSSNSNSNNRSSYSGKTNNNTRSSNTTGTIQRRGSNSNNSSGFNRSSSTNSRSSSVRSSGSSSRSSYGSSSRSSSSSSRSSSSGSSRSSRR